MYTIYWERSEKKGKFTQAFLKDAQKIISASKTAGISLASWDGEGEPELTAKRISFNGKGDESYESFTLSANPADDSFHFCKTAGRPYTHTVLALLLKAKEHGIITSFSDDGLDEDEVKTLDSVLSVMNLVYFKGSLTYSKY